jgi:spermine/spermidine synthase
MESTRASQAFPALDTTNIANSAHALEDDIRVRNAQKLVVDAATSSGDRMSVGSFKGDLRLTRGSNWHEPICYNYRVIPPNDSRKYASLALISFVTLYLELVVIRWLASEVLIFAYFKNFPLLAAFFGLGVGCILASKGRNYFQFAPLLLLLVVAVITLARWGGYTHITFVDPFENYLLGQFTFEHPIIQMFKGMGAVLAIFSLVAALFVSLGEKLGESFRGLPPLSAYSVNVGFSLVGILVFALLSRISSGPAIWVLVAIAALFPFFWKPWSAAFFAAAFLLSLWLTPQTVLWSPYYRVEVVPVELRSQSGAVFSLGYNVNLNHDGMEGAYNYRDDFVRSLPSDVQDQLTDYYNVPYRIFGPQFKKILVLGAGAGNDVAAALRNGVQTIDAVEIDPKIIDVGKRYHPELPYASPSVRIHVADARTFLRDPRNNGYDMVVFGALDSHAAFSSMSSIRLDNYVYTVESFQEALRRLSPHGILAVTFYCYKTWQIERVFNALWRANGPKPVVVYSLGVWKNNLVMLAGPGANREQLEKQSYVKQQDADDLVGHGSSVEPTSDDWPFLYLRTRGFPFSYLSMLILILGFSYIAMRRTLQVTSSKFDGVMFLLGAGFMLLETKVLAKVALLTGATWVVNTYVISAVLIMILLANVAVMKGWFRSIPAGFAALFASVILDWYLRFNTLQLVRSPTISLTLDLIFLAVPVFFAGTLFAIFLERADGPASALGYNLLGVMVGGVLEYSSMAWGINNLNLVCVAVYAAAALVAYRESRIARQLPVAVARVSAST